MIVNDPKKGTRISILLYIPGHIVLKIGASTNAHVSALRKALPKNQEFNFYYEGTLLNDVFTLATYGIKNLDVILAVPPNSRSDINISWLKNTTPELLLEKLEQAKNQACRQEMLRLNDIQMAKFDFAQHQFHRFIRSVSAPAVSERTEPIEKNLSSIELKQYSSIQSKEPLPCFWTDSPLDLNPCPEDSSNHISKSPP